MAKSGEKEFMILGGVCMNDELLTTVYTLSPTGSSTSHPSHLSFADRFFYNQTFPLNTHKPLADFTPYQYKLHPLQAKLLIGRNGLHIVPGAKSDFKKHGIISLEISAYKELMP